MWADPELVDKEIQRLEKSGDAADDSAADALSDIPPFVPPPPGTRAGSSALTSPSISRTTSLEAAAARPDSQQTQGQAAQQGSLFSLGAPPQSNP